MPPMSAPPDAASRSAIRRQVGRYMVTGGLLGWGVVACVVAGAMSERGTWPETAWFAAAFFVMLALLACLIKGYRLEDKHNPNFAPQERAQLDSTPTMPQTHAGSTGDK